MGAGVTSYEETTADRTQLYEFWRSGIIPGIPQAGTFDEFLAMLDAAEARLTSGGLFLYFLYRKQTPVGLVAVERLDMGEAYVYDPHVRWTSYATPRDRLSCAAAFFCMWADEDNPPLLVHSDEASRPLFARLAEYGILRTVGDHDARKFEPPGELIPVYLYSL